MRDNEPYNRDARPVVTVVVFQQQSPDLLLL